MDAAESGGDGRGGLRRAPPRRTPRPGCGAAMLMRFIVWVVRLLDLAIVGYLTTFFLVHLSLVLAGFVSIRRALLREMVRPAARAEKSSFLPFITLLVPAYNEEVTIVESLRSQLS